MPLLKNNSRLFHAISLIEDGNMSFRWGEFDLVLNNRMKWLKKIGLDINKCVNLATQDSDSIVIATKKDSGKGMHSYENAIKADGLVTNEKNLTLFLLIADCLPVIFFDLTKEVLALGHLGWRGTEAKLVQKIIDKMTDEFGSNPSDIQATICPGIQKKIIQI